MLGTLNKEVVQMTWTQGLLPEMLKNFPACQTNKIFDEYPPCPKGEKGNK